MKHRLTFALAAAALACASLGAAAAADHGHGQLFRFSGELLAAPGPKPGSVYVQAVTDTTPALRALTGASQTQVFTLGSGTEVLIWSHGVPHVGTTADLHQGDYVTVRIRAPHDSSLQQIEAQQAAVVADAAAPNGGQPLWLFAGNVSGAQS